MTKGLDDLKACATRVATKALAHIEKGKYQEKSLEEVLNFMKGHKEATSSLEDQVMAASGHYFEKARDQVDFFY